MHFWLRLISGFIYIYLSICFIITLLVFKHHRNFVCLCCHDHLHTIFFRGYVASCNHSLSWMRTIWRRVLYAGHFCFVNSCKRVGQICPRMFHFSWHWYGCSSFREDRPFFPIWRWCCKNCRVGNKVCSCCDMWSHFWLSIPFHLLLWICCTLEDTVYIFCSWVYYTGGYQGSFLSPLG